MDSFRTVAARYKLVRPIGVGGMGRVWDGVDERLGRRVAVKVVKPELLDGPQRDESVARFRREAQVTARLSHPGVPAIFDADFDPDGEDLYLVMAYIDGLALHDLIAEEGPLPAAWAVAIAAQIASTLTAAHDSDVVHRDLKPANVIVGTDGRVSVVDFGIAAVLRPGASRLTATGEKPGTLHYMAPEQIRARPVGPAADLYALGALLFEMLTGTPLFAELSSPYDVQTAHLREPPAPVRNHRPELPAELERLIGELLRKDPGERPTGAAETFHRLWAIMERLPTPDGDVPRCGDPTWPIRAPLAPASIAASIADRPAPRAEPTALYSTDPRWVAAERQFRNGDYDAALAAFRDLARAFTEVDPVASVACQTRVARSLAAMGHTAPALSALDSVVKREQSRSGGRDRETLRARRLAVELMRMDGDTASASDALETLIGDMAAALGPSDADTVEARELASRWRAVGTRR